MSNPPKTHSSERDVSVDYLRTTITLMVVAHHSALAYTTFARFDADHYLASTAPVVDSTRWIFLDYAQNFNDVFFMSLMFLISGLFVWPSMQRQGAATFLRDRLARLGLPFVVFASLWMPLAYYGSWQLTGNDKGYVDFWLHHFFADGWPPGPLWFIWVLFLFDIVIALARAAGLKLTSTDALHRCAKEHAVRSAITIALVCAVCFILALYFFGGKWIAFFTKPFYFELPRIGVYFTWFMCGVLIGTASLDRGLFSRQGSLVRHWPAWIVAAALAYNVHFFVPKLLRSAGFDSDIGVGFVWAVTWIASCVISCFAFASFFRGITLTRRNWMDSLTRNAYIIYIVHYAFVVWLQRALMGVSLHAGIKFAVVFFGALLLSWLTGRILLTIPLLRKAL